MITTPFNRNRTFNVPRLRAELIRFNVQFSGFENTGLGRVSPFAEDSRVIARDGVAKTDDIANRGDIRIVSEIGLIQSQINQINNALDAHDSTSDTPDQAIGRQKAVDIEDLKVKFAAGIVDATRKNIVKVLLDEVG